MLVLIGVSIALSGCATYPGWLATSGPSRQQVQDSEDSLGINNIQLVTVNEAIARKLLARSKQNLFSATFTSPKPSGDLIGDGDMVEVSVWEAPPAMLFGGATVVDPTIGAATTRVTTFPEQMVSSEGTINIPFAGRVAVAGHNPQWIEQEIAEKLDGLAHKPQVLVRVTHNASANVTIVGEVATSTRMPLTAKGELLLDALAASGGIKLNIPINKISLQVTRGEKVQSMPLDQILRDPRQNIRLQSGDLVAALYQPLSFMVLGATGKNDEINFEAQGISLAQALGRIGGLNDARADARGLFIFRMEDKTALDLPENAKTAPDEKVPVIYEVDLRNPASFFVAQSFPVQNGDVLYVSDAPSAELHKFMSLVVQTIYPAVAAKQLNIIQ